MFPISAPFGAPFGDLNRDNDRGTVKIKYLKSPSSSTTRGRKSPLTLPSEPKFVDIRHDGPWSHELILHLHRVPIYSPLPNVVSSKQCPASSPVESEMACFKSKWIMPQLGFAGCRGFTSAANPDHLVCLDAYHGKIMIVDVKKKSVVKCYNTHDRSNPTQPTIKSSIAPTGKCIRVPGSNVLIYSDASHATIRYILPNSDEIKHLAGIPSTTVTTQNIPDGTHRLQANIGYSMALLLQPIPEADMKELLRIGKPFDETVIEAIGHHYLYFADQIVKTIYRMDPFGNITTWSGATKYRNFSLAHRLEMSIFVESMCWHIDGFMLIGTCGHKRIFAADPKSGIITNYAGHRKSSIHLDGPRLQASVGSVSDIVCDKYGQIFFTDDSFECIRMIDACGFLMTLTADKRGANRNEGPIAYSFTPIPTALHLSENDNSLYVILGIGGSPIVRFVPSPYRMHKIDVRLENISVVDHDRTFPVIEPATLLPFGKRKDNYLLIGQRIICPDWHEFAEAAAVHYPKLKDSLLYDHIPCVPNSKSGEAIAQFLTSGVVNSTAMPFSTYVCIIHTAALFDIAPLLVSYSKHFAKHIQQTCNEVEAWLVEEEKLGHSKLKPRGTSANPNPRVVLPLDEQKPEKISAFEVKDSFRDSYFVSTDTAYWAPSGAQWPLMAMGYHELCYTVDQDATSDPNTLRPSTIEPVDAPSTSSESPTATNLTDLRTGEALPPPFSPSSDGWTPGHISYRSKCLEVIRKTIANANQLMEAFENIQTSQPSLLVSLPIIQQLLEDIDEVYMMDVIFMPPSKKKSAESRIALKEGEPLPIGSCFFTFDYPPKMMDSDLLESERCTGDYFTHWETFQGSRKILIDLLQQKITTIQSSLIPITRQPRPTFMQSITEDMVQIHSNNALKPLHAELLAKLQAEDISPEDAQVIQDQLLFQTFLNDNAPLAQECISTSIHPNKKHVQDIIDSIKSMPSAMSLTYPTDFVLSIGNSENSYSLSCHRHILESSPWRPFLLEELSGKPESDNRLNLADKHWTKDLLVSFVRYLYDYVISGFTIPMRAAFISLCPKIGIYKNIEEKIVHAGFEPLYNFCIQPIVYPNYNSVKDVVLQLDFAKTIGDDLLYKSIMSRFLQANRMASEFFTTSKIANHSNSNYSTSLYEDDFLDSDGVQFRYPYHLEKACRFVFGLEDVASEDEKLHY